jgi:hypothetical protein
MPRALIITSQVSSPDRRLRRDRSHAAALNRLATLRGTGSMTPSQGG